MTDEKPDEWEEFKESIFEALDKYENIFRKQDEGTRIRWNMEIQAHRNAMKIIQKIDDIENILNILRDEMEELKGENR